MKGCHICGGVQVRIRGRTRLDSDRTVCPTCMADRLEIIRDYADPRHGMAMQEGLLTEEQTKKLVKKDES